MAVSHAFPKLRRTVYFGTFAHTVSQDYLSILEHAAVGVDEDGRIAFIKDVGDALDTTVRTNGWQDYDVVRAESSGTVGFWFPGFVGESCCTALKKM